MNNLFLFMSNSKNTGYLNHQLNDSNSKATYTFPKQRRFDTPGRRVATQAMYFPPVDLHSTKSISFGYGKKSQVIGNTQSPSPDKYVLRREFDTVEAPRGISFGLGRDVNTFGDMFGKTRMRLPGVGAYKIENQCQKTNGGYIGQKLGSFLAKDDNGPGPGQYDVSAVDLGHSGVYVLSKYKNPQQSGYRFKTEQSSTEQSRRHSPSKKPQVGPGSCKHKNKTDKQIDNFNPEGTYQVSQHMSTKGWTFGRSRRRSIVEDLDNTPGPGLYTKFSVFGGNPDR